MKIQSLIEEQNQLKPVEVELTLWPGLPGIQFLGLPDQAVKESAWRIKSAIKSAGFQFPIAQQILVNLRPSHLRKTSRGLELAVAVAYLWETGQIQKPSFDSNFFVYGELSLSGEVMEPENLVTQFFHNQAVVLTGSSEKDATFRRLLIPSLAELNSPIDARANKDVFRFMRPQAGIRQHYTASQARLLEILAVGEHSALIAGPQGSGKTTVGKALPSFLREPEFLEKENMRKALGGAISDWRPFVKPHHSTPIVSMIGGGNSPVIGEIARSHGGVLLLDELLEFPGPVQEALREPFEDGKMRVARAGKFLEYPVESQILATTNLCKCGLWTPVMKPLTCKLSGTRCRSYSQKLSGPFLDRFEILEFTSGIKDINISGDKILKKVQAAQEFSKKLFKDETRANFRSVNSKRSIQEILKTVKASRWNLVGSEEISSQRRKMAILRVSRTLADLDFKAEIEMKHIDEAVIFCKTNFTKFQSPA